jgi:hypothetical protein
MQHIFVSRENGKFPEVGDLIRRNTTGQFINIVLDVSEIQYGGERQFIYVRSVRYGTTNNGNFKLLQGTRSKSIKFYLCGIWTIVDEFTVANNMALRRHIVKSLENVDTTYRREESDV